MAGLWYNYHSDECICLIQSPSFSYIYSLSHFRFTQKFYRRTLSLAVYPSSSKPSPPCPTTVNDIRGWRSGTSSLAWRGSSAPRSWRNSSRLRMKWCWGGSGTCGKWITGGRGWRKGRGMDLIYRIKGFLFIWIGYFFIWRGTFFIWIGYFFIWITNEFGWCVVVLRSWSIFKKRKITWLEKLRQWFVACSRTITTYITTGVFFLLRFIQDGN